MSNIRAFGVGPGCYVMLPIFGPSTIRDSIGVVGNTLLDPFYLSTVGDRNMLLDNNLWRQNLLYRGRI